MDNIKKIEKSINAQIGIRHQSHAKFMLVFYLILAIVLPIITTSYERSVNELMSILVSIFALTMFTYLFVLLLLKYVVNANHTVLGVAHVEGYIRHKTIEYLNPNGGVVRSELYYLDIIAATDSFEAIAINALQYKKVSALHSKNPTKLFKSKVAVLEPTVGDKLVKDTRAGTLVLLPFEKYMYVNNTGAVIDNGEEGDSYIAPMQLGRQPVFNAARYPEIRDDAPYEDVLSSGMSIIKFEHFDDVTLKSEMVAEGDRLVDYDNISDVVDQTGPTYEEFMDFRTRKEPKVHRKGPNFLGYCLIFYLINFLLIRNHAALQDSYLFVNILITSVLVLGYIFFIYVPFQVRLPVRFHRANDEVYIYHKQGLYRVPWQKLDVSVVARKLDSDVIYDLVVWLPSQYNYADNSTPDSCITLYSSKNIHGKVYYYWDYINRYMNFDPYFEEYIEADDKPKQKEKEERDPTNGMNLFDLFIGLVAFFMFPFVILFLVSNPNHLRVRLNPNKQKWPKIVHQWSGRKSNWY